VRFGVVVPANLSLVFPRSGTPLQFSESSTSKIA